MKSYEVEQVLNLIEKFGLIVDFSENYLQKEIGASCFIFSKKVNASNKRYICQNIHKAELSLVIKDKNNERVLVTITAREIPNFENPYNLERIEQIKIYRFGFSSQKEIQLEESIKKALSKFLEPFYKKESEVKEFYSNFLQLR